MNVSNIGNALFGIVQGVVGLIVGAVCSVSAIWAGELHFRNGMPLVYALGCAILVGATLLIWRLGSKIGAVSLVAGALGGPFAVFGFLAYSASVGAPL